MDSGELIKALLEVVNGHTSRINELEDEIKKLRLLVDGITPKQEIKQGG